MDNTPETAAIPKSIKWVSYVISAPPVLLMLLSALVKLVNPEGLAELEHIGWRPDQMFAIGIVEIACVVIYLIPRTAILGAILISAIMGGAVATHVRVGDPFWVPVLAGLLVWLGLYLRNMSLRAMVANGR